MPDLRPKKGQLNWRLKVQWRYNYTEICRDCEEELIKDCTSKSITPPPFQGIFYVPFGWLEKICRHNLTKTFNQSIVKSIYESPGPTPL